MKFTLSAVLLTTLSVVSVRAAPQTTSEPIPECITSACAPLLPAVSKCGISIEQQQQSPDVQAIKCLCSDPAYVSGIEACLKCFDSLTDDPRFNHIDVLKSIQEACSNPDAIDDTTDTTTTESDDTATETTGTSDAPTDEATTTSAEQSSYTGGAVTNSTVSGSKTVPAPSRTSGAQTSTPNAASGYKAAGGMMGGVLAIAGILFA